MRAVGQVHRHQGPVAEFVPQVPGREQPDAGPAEAGGLQAFDAARGKAAGGADPAFLARDLERPMGRPAQHQAFMLGQVRDRRRGAPPGEIGWCRAQHARIARQPARDQAAVAQAPDAQRQIGAARDDVDQAVGQFEVDAQVRMGVQQAGNDRRHDLAAERGRRGHAQQARHAGRGRPEAGAPGRFALDQRLGERQEGLAFRRQRHRPGRALHQAHPEVAFEGGEPARRDHRGDAEPPRGGRQIAGAGGGDQDGDGLGVHYIDFRYADCSIPITTAFIAMGPDTGGVIVLPCERAR